MNSAPSVTREQVVAYRVAAQGLHREARDVHDLAVLDLGVQEAMGQPAGYAFAARLDPAAPVGPTAFVVGPGHPLALAWTLRGAPHVHRRTDLDRVAAALWPLSEADAGGRLNETGPSVRAAGIAALEQFRLAVTAMRDVVTAPTAKGAVSTAASLRLPPVMLRDCRPCKAHHISDSAMRAAAPAAGLELEPGTAPPVLLPRKGANPPDALDVGALRGLATAYLTLLGPATFGEVAAYLEARRADVDAALAGLPGVAQVSVDGRAAYLPHAALPALFGAPTPRLVRLLGPFDPYLQARDRALIVPDKGAHKRLWPVLGRPGVLFVDGEVAGTWRTKASGKKLTITVEAFAPLRTSRWLDVEHEATRIGEVRGAGTVTVVRRH